MRAIKFRGKVDGVWWYVSPDHNPGLFGSFWFVVDRDTVGQFIGEKDKTGQEVYEDDIIKADWHWDEPHKIQWPHDYYALLEYSLEGDNLEVIGNIYDTPELLPKEINPLDVFEGGEI